MKDIERFFEGTANNYFLLGPRGTGKTYWLYENYPAALRIDLLSAETYRLLKGNPELLEDWIINEYQQHIVIDEIQKIPELLDTVHLLIEKWSNKQFILTGSSARKLRRSGVNLLGGRASNMTMHPYMGSELGSLFALEKALQIGMLPLVWAAREPLVMLKGYAALYLKEEVKEEGIVRSIGDFSRFLEAISFSQGSPMNVSNIARECQVPRKTAEGYIHILEDLLLSFRLEVFSKRAQRELKSSPKFYYFDAGVYRSIRPKGPFDSPNEMDGVTLETLVAQHLRAWCDYSRKEHKLYYWQTKSGLEVDFIIYGETGIYAIEVKNTKQISSSDLRGLREFQKDYPEAQLLYLYRGKYLQKEDNVLCIPCELFLSELKPDVIWNE